MTVITNLHLGIAPTSPGETISLKLVPLEHHSWWVETTWQTVGRLNAGQPEHDVINWWIRTNAVGT